MGNIGKATEPCISTTSDNQPKQVTDIFLAVPSSLTSEMIRIRNLYRFMYRQHVYDWEKRRGDCLMKWLIMLGFMDLRGPRVCRRSTPVLYYNVDPNKTKLLSNLNYQWKIVYEMCLIYAISQHCLCFIISKNETIWLLTWDIHTYQYVSSWVTFIEGPGEHFKNAYNS